MRRLSGAYRRTVLTNLRRQLHRVRRRVRGDVARADPLLSVVMPVYNVERYLAEAVDSVLSQSYRNLELILVDDGATDSSGEMCDEYAATDTRVRVIHQQNAGLGAARNTGIAAARGRYIVFIDSDDYVLEDAYLLMMRTILRTGSDLVTGNVLRRLGRQLEQSWIQSRSHLENRDRVTLVDEPALLSDTVAWNKIYRTSFWRKYGKTFPVGKLYEDTATIFGVLAGATAIDIVSEPVYVWRLRDERDSITQKLIEVQNIDDRFEMLAHVDAMIRNAGLWDVLGNRLLHKVLEVDLWVYVRALVDTQRVEAVKRIEVLSRNYWDASPDEVKRRVPAERRVCYWLLANERPSDMLAFRWWYSSIDAAPPLVRTNGNLALDITTCPVNLDGLPDVALEMGDLAEAVVNVMGVQWVDAATLTLHGYGYTRLVSDGKQAISLTATNAATGKVVSWPTERMALVESARWARDLMSPHDHDGFKCVIDVSSLVPLSTEDRRGNEWTLGAVIDDGDIKRTTVLDKVWRLGSGSVVGASVVTDSVVASVKTDPDTVIRIRLDPVVALAAAFDVAADTARIKLASAPPHLTGIRFATVDKTASVEATADDDGWYVAQLPPRTERPGMTKWRALAITDKPDFGATQHPVMAPQNFTAGSTPNPKGLRTNATRAGHAIVEVGRQVAVVDQASCTATGDIQVGGFLLDLEELEVGLAPAGGVPSSWRAATVENGRFSALLPVAAALDGLPLATGRYYIQVRVATAAGPVPAENYLADATAGQLPTDQLAPTAKVRLIRGRGGRLAADVSAPVPDELLGRYAQDQIIRRHSAIPRELADAVFFLVDVGANAADSAVAIHNELRRRGTTMPLYWGVDDLSVPLPDGAIPVVKRSEQWFSAVNHSRYIVNNYGGVWGLRKDPHQRYLQTWHGTPLKYIGASEARHRGEHKPRFDQIEAEAADWDAFVSPSPYFTELIPSEFLYHGEILETGYPRNDRLAVTTDAERIALREHFAIPAGKRVLLYAPTFRDAERRGWKAPLYDGLDLNRLLELLGPEWVLLLRGHIFNANDDNLDRSGKAIIDVTRHHDVNDLYLASDVLVTDYSSVMFDYAVTGRPMAFFTPDLETYEATRGTYFDLRDEAPGPLYRKVDDLAAGLLDLDTLVAEHRAGYERFQKKYVPWDDGMAAARVVDAFFT